MADTRSVLREIGEVLRKGLDFRSAWARPESEKLEEMRDVSAILLVMPAYLLMHQSANAQSAGQRYFYVALAYALCLVAVIVHSKQRRFMLWAVYLPQLASSLLLVSLFPDSLGENGSDVPAYGAFVLCLIGATIAIVRRRELRFVHVGLTFFPLALIPW